MSREAVLFEKEDRLGLITVHRSKGEEFPQHGRLQEVSTSALKKLRQTAT